MMDNDFVAPAWSDAQLLSFADKELAVLRSLENDSLVSPHHPGKVAMKHLVRYMDGDRDDAMKHAFRAMECHYRSEAYLDDSKMADGECEDIGALMRVRSIKMNTAYGYLQLAQKVRYDLTIRRMKQEADTAFDYMVDATRLVPTTIDATLIPKECFCGKDVLR